MTPTSSLFDILRPHARTIRGYGWRPDTPDARDTMLPRKITNPAHLPASVNLRDSPCQPPIWDQGNLGSCTAHGAARCFEFAQRAEGLSDYTPSRLFIYFGERVLDGTVDTDAGSTIRQSMKVLASVGAPHETLWPYDEARFRTVPSDAATQDAAKHRCVTYLSIDPDENAIKSALAEGFPFSFGFTVYESFESDDVARTGRVPVPAATERAVGGHCVSGVGYTDAASDPTGHSQLICANSWGTDWGQSGYFTLPFDFFTRGDADDCWTVRAVQCDA